MNHRPNIEHEKSETKESILYDLIDLKFKKGKDSVIEVRVELLISLMGM